MKQRNLCIRPVCSVQVAQGITHENKGMNCKHITFFLAVRWVEVRGKQSPIGRGESWGMLG